MSYDYQRANSELTGRCKDSRKIGNNTYLIRRYEGAIAIRLHTTDVVTFYPNGDIQLNTGGWNTPTTHDRLGYARGVRLSREWRGIAKGRRLVIWQGQTYNFEDSRILLRVDGTTDSSLYDPDKEVKERDKKREQARAELKAKLAADIKALKAAGLKQQSIVIRLEANEDGERAEVRTARAFVSASGLFAIHPDVQKVTTKVVTSRTHWGRPSGYDERVSYHTRFDGEWTLTHLPSGAFLFNSLGSVERLLQLLGNAEPLADHIGGALAMRRLGCPNKELEQDIWRKVSW